MQHRATFKTFGSLSLQFFSSQIEETFKLLKLKTFIIQVLKSSYKQILLDPWNIFSCLRGSLVKITDTLKKGQNKRIVTKKQFKYKCKKIKR